MYNLLIMQTDASGETSRAVYAYNDWDTALSAFHSELAYRHESRKKTVCTILDEDGISVKNEVWERKNNEESV